MIRFKPELIERIDDEERRIYFRKGRLKRITGSRLATVLGENDFETPFSAAINMAGIYSEYEPTKYTEAGEAIEPIIRNYARGNWESLFAESLGISEKDWVEIEEPEPKHLCNYEHFPRAGMFGGMVDGYITVNGMRAAVLEVKTSKSKTYWTDGDGGYAVPRNYALQASLYAELSGLDKIVFVTGILEEEDYDDPRSWTPSSDNCFSVTIGKGNISKDMDLARDWLESTLSKGFTPQWSDEDLPLVEYIKENL